ncbi:MAG: S8 family serine peptidase [Kordiimonadaceae bacterium]|nr:S8 family serine peptidase [Kordiimonadaceae bacterium]
MSIVTLLLSGCGGGAGVNGGTTNPTIVNPPSPVPNPNPTPTPIAYNTAEYRQNPSLAQMNVQAAYLNGITGDGILVAVVDSGVTEVPELQGKLHPDSTNIATGDPNDRDDFNGHGTAMAGIIAANRDQNTNFNSFNMHGSAFNAQILNINSTTAADCTDFNNCSFFHSKIALAYDYAVAHNADIINESLGSESLSSPALQLAMKNAVDAGILIVLPAGNIDDADPPGTGDSIEGSSEVAYADWANGQIIVAGSVDENNVISDFSFKAGDAAKNVYLMAPGSGIIAPDHDLSNDYQYVEIQGTSASTAQISGIAALLMEAFPNLNAAQVADLLFTTATDLGDPGVDAIYGRGLVNVAEAFRAQGTLSIAGTGIAAGVDIGTTDKIAQQNLIFSGGAFGADISFSGEFSNVMVLDKYQRSFHVNFSGGIYTPDPVMALDSFLDYNLSSRYQQMRLNDQTTLKLGWQHNTRFSEVDKNIFSGHLGRERRAENLRMSLAYDISDKQTARISSGMSLVEMMEDYRPDDYIAQGKFGFSSLLNAHGLRALSYKTMLGKSSTFETAYASSKMTFNENFIGYNIKSESTLLMNRYSQFVSDKFLISFDLGLLNEQGSVLGAVSTGALEIGSGARTAFSGTNLDYSISDKSGFFVRASYGITTVDQSGKSLLSNVSTLKSMSYLVGLKSRGLIFENDQVTLTMSQPLRLQTGYATISNAIGRNYLTGKYTMAYNRFSLTPGGREQDFELSYSIADFHGARLQLNFLHQLNPGHLKSIKSATSILFRLGSAF